MEVGKSADLLCTSSNLNTAAPMGERRINDRAELDIPPWANWTEASCSDSNANSYRLEVVFDGYQAVRR